MKIRESSEVTCTEKALSINLRFKFPNSGSSLPSENAHRAAKNK
jgi:hypothetical protein